MFELGPDDFLPEEQGSSALHEESEPSLKRPRHELDEAGDADEPVETHHASATTHVFQPTPDDPEANTVVYGASSFGGFGEYMRRKRAKLQIQNAQIGASSGGIFKGLEIYVSTNIFAYARLR